MNDSSWRNHSLVQLALVRLREFYREPEAVFWVFVFPLILATGLGIAFRHRAPDPARIGVVRGSPGADSLVRDMAGDSLLRAELLDAPAAAEGLRTGKLTLVVEGAAHGVTYRYDETRDDASAARLLVDRDLQRAAGRTDPVGVREEHITERGSRYIDFVLPGLLGMNIMGSGFWGIGFAIVDARKKKLLKRLTATPMSRAQYLASFMVLRLMLLTVEVVTLVAFGYFVFKVPARGPLWVLATVCLTGSLAFSGLGLLIASRTRTTEGVNGLMNLVMLPMWIFSGVFFSSERFPAAVQPIVQALPLTAINNALRANLLQGASIAQVAGELGILLAWGVVGFSIALGIFRWK